ncbi:MAG: prepilin-type N-terminal cleavage/methylation domain-containing protein [Syntrophobacterales bacterium]|nr:prepilin-type N-terminal cleavage/methylation domain-containing protein [Syntrophobacterales bacterium]
MKNKNQKGFTLLEVLVAMVFFLICSIGLVSFTVMAIGERKNIERRHQAYAIAQDIAERLRGIPNNSNLIRPTSSNENTYIRYDEGEIKYCSSLSVVTTSEFSPLGNGLLFLYDSNHDGEIGTSEINISSNPKIDHPNSSMNYDIIKPIRKVPDGTTFYTIWGVRYMPCNIPERQAKIFITVYWIEPEPTDDDVSVVAQKISSNIYRLKTVSYTTDRFYGVSQ